MAGGPLRFGPTKASGLWVPATDYHDRDTPALAPEEWASRPDFVNSNGNAFACVAGIVGVIGAALVFGAFAPHVPAQPGLQKSWEQRATQRAHFVAGRASVFGQPPASVGVTSPPLRPTPTASDQQRQFQPQSIVFKQPPASVAAASLSLSSTLITAESQRQFQPQPFIQSHTEFAPAQPELKSPWEQRGTHHRYFVEGRAVVFKPHAFAPPVVESPPFRPTTVLQEAQRQFQPQPVIVAPTYERIAYAIGGFQALDAQQTERGYAVVFKPIPAATVAAADQPRGMVVAAPQADPRQLAARIFGTLPVVATPLRPTTNVVPEAQRQYQVAPLVFGTLPVPATPLRPAIVVPEAQRRYQPSALVFGTLPVPATPLRQALVINAEQSKVQPAPRIFGTPLLPTVTDTPLTERHFVIPEAQSQKQSAPVLFGTLPLPATPLRPTIVVPPQSDPTQIAARVFGTPLLPSAVDTPLTERHFIVPQQTDPTQRPALVYGSALAPSAGDTPLTERHFVVPPQSDPTQRPAFVFGSPHLPSAQDTPLTQRHFVSSPQRDPTQIAAEVFGQSPPTTPTVPLRQTLIVPGQAQSTQPQPLVFEYPTIVPDQVAGAVLRASPQAQPYLSAQVYGSALLPSVGTAPPLRPTFIALASHYREQPAARIFGKQPEPAGAIDCEIETNNPPQTVSTQSPNAGAIGGVPPPFRATLPPPIRVIMETSQVESVRGKLSLVLPSEARTGIRSTQASRKTKIVELTNGGQAQSSELRAMLIITCDISTEQNSLPEPVVVDIGQVQGTKAFARMMITARAISGQAARSEASVTLEAATIAPEIKEETIPTYDGDDLPDTYKDV